MAAYKESFSYLESEFRETSTGSPLSYDHDNLNTISNNKTVLK